MEEKTVQNILVEILRSVVNESVADDSLKQVITPDIFPSLHRLAKKHDLSHIVSHFVYHNHIGVPAEIWERLQHDEVLSVYRCEQMKYAFEEICCAFDEAQIAYIPLKGSVIRPYYPIESMRTSCDVDILIHEEDLEEAIRCLEAKGYRCGDRNYHDVSLYSPNNMHLELHFHIQENIDSLDAVLKDAWAYAEASEGSRFDFRKEFFVFHIYAHMAYHFVSGGCGIRSLVDIWIMEHKMDATYACAEELLRKAGIYQFAVEMSRLADTCFSGSACDEFSELVLAYIYRGGVYGSLENNITVKKTKSNSSVVYAFKRLFLPYKTMVILYPILKKTPILLPFCWVARWIQALFGGKTKKFASEISCANNISDNQMADVREIFLRLGL